MKYRTLRRFIDRQMMSTIFEQDAYHDLPDWFWEAVFELFTHE